MPMESARKDIIAQAHASICSRIPSAAETSAAATIVAAAAAKEGVMNGTRAAT